MRLLTVSLVLMASCSNMAEPESVTQSVGDDLSINDVDNTNQNDGRTPDMVQCNDLGDAPAIWIEADGSVFYTAEDGIRGFQFAVDGASIIGVDAGGAVDSAGFSTQNGDKIVVSFSPQADSLALTDEPALLVKLELDGEPTGLSNVIVGGQSASKLNFPAATGACN